MRNLLFQDEIPDAICMLLSPASANCNYRLARKTLTNPRLNKQFHVCLIWGSIGCFTYPHGGLWIEILFQDEIPDAICMLLSPASANCNYGLARKTWSNMTNPRLNNYSRVCLFDQGLRHLDSLAYPYGGSHKNTVPRWSSRDNLHATIASFC